MAKALEKWRKAHHSHRPENNFNPAERFHPPRCHPEWSEGSAVCLRNMQRSGKPHISDLKEADTTYTEETMATDPENVNQQQKRSRILPQRIGFMIGQLIVPDDFDSMARAEIEALFTGTANSSRDEDAADHTER